MPQRNEAGPTPNRGSSEIAFILRHAKHKPGAQVMREMASGSRKKRETETAAPPWPKRALRGREAR
ncbi:MAG: hypothetical protein KIT16_15310 [Rhodospirillaceae bacterium]|nr:hypothetical protein [Rhodospirillaceae bacterium]